MNLTELAGTYFQVLQAESPRGRVLVSCAYLEDLLGQILSAFVVDVLESEAFIKRTLGSFFSRIEAALALGLISRDEYDEVSKLRAIRNKFAHNLTASFSDPDIIKQCDALKFRPMLLSLPLARESKEKALSDFTGSAVSLVMSFTFRIQETSKKRCSFGTVPPHEPP